VTVRGSASPAGTAAPGQRRLIILVGVAIAIVALAIAAATAFGGPGRQVETGIVVSVQATGITAVQGFSIRTLDGRTVDFRIESTENAAAFPPGHLSEHKVSLVPVRVTFIDRAGSHLAVRIEDAP
jgi:hypothetical protein